MNNHYPPRVASKPETTLTVADTSSIGPLVRNFFQLLNDNEISWAILRGSDGLPEYTRYDIDILVKPEDLQRTKIALDKAVAIEGWEIITITDKYRYQCFLLVSPGPQHCFLPIDLFSGCYYRFYPDADAVYALQHRQKNTQGVWVVPPGFGAVESLIKELMRHDIYKANSREETQAAALVDPDSFIVGGEAYLGKRLVQRLLTACQRAEWEQVHALAPEIRRSVRTYRLQLLPGLLAFFWKNFRHNLKPPMSLFIVLLGPDGAGKSTVGDLVAEQLYHRPFKICRRFEHNFRLLPELKRFKAVTARLLGHKFIQKQPLPPGTKGSGMNKEHSALRAILYVTYYSLDLLIGRLLLCRLRGQGGLIIFARYFYDYYFQKGYGHVPHGFLKLIECLIPTPDLVLYLHRSAEDIYAGKPELDLIEIKHQQKVISELLKSRENTYIVDASSGVDATVKKVRDLAISHWLAKATTSTWP